MLCLHGYLFMERHAQTRVSIKLSEADFAGERLSAACTERWIRVEPQPCGTRLLRTKDNNWCELSQGALCTLQGAAMYTVTITTVPLGGSLSTEVKDSIKLKIQVFAPCQPVRCMFL